MVIILVSGKAESGKDTFAELLKAYILKKSPEKVVLTPHFAGYVKFIAKEYFGWDGNKDEAGRSLLQYVGETARREQPTFWIDAVMDTLSIFGDGVDVAIIPDCRYKNELGLFKEQESYSGNSIFSVRVTRPDYENRLTEEQRQHISEVDLDDAVFDINISNTDIKSFALAIEHKWDWILMQEKLKQKICGVPEDETNCS